MIRKLMDCVGMFVNLQEKDNVAVFCVTEYISRYMTGPSHEASASIKSN